MDSECSCRRSSAATIFVRRMALGAAGWRDDAVHAQVLDHLAVVIEAVTDNQSRHSQTCCCSFTKGIFDVLDGIGLVYRSESLVHVGKGIFQELHDVGL